MKHVLLLLVLLTLPSLAQADQIETAFSPHRGATALIVRTIGSAEKTIRVAAYLLTSRPVANALVKAKRRGVDIEVVLDKQQCESSGGEANFLAENGVAVRKNALYPNMHDKFMVIDGETIELGSFNYTRTAEEQNAENVLVLHNRPDIAKAYMEQWDRLWEEGK